MITIRRLPRDPTPRVQWVKAFEPCGAPRLCLGCGQQTALLVRLAHRRVASGPLAERCKVCGWVFDYGTQGAAS